MTHRWTVTSTGGSETVGGPWQPQVWAIVGEDSVPHVRRGGGGHSTREASMGRQKTPQGKKGKGGKKQPGQKGG